MNPNIGPAPRRRVASVAVPAAVVVALAVTVAWSVWPMAHPAREIRVAQVVYNARVPSAAMSESQPNASAAVVQAPGWLEADPYLVAASGLADGIVESVAVLEGDRVEAGQVVARLVSEDSRLRLRSAESALARARAVLSDAEAERRAAGLNWEHPIGLERAVDASRAALAEAQADLDRLPSLLASAEATLVSLEEQRDRVRESSQRNVANDIELIVAQQRVEAQRSDLAAVRASRGILRARVDRLAAELAFAERDAELRIDDRRRLDAAGAAVARAQAELQLAEASRDEASLELDRMTIRAPISGFVQRRVKMPGDKLVRMMDSPHSTHVVHLYDPSRIQVRADIPLADAAGVFVGQRCEVIVEVLPDRVFRGEVTRITHEADLQKNTLQAKVRVIDPDPLLRPEMLTRVRFLAGGPAETAAPERGGGSARLLVPSDAITHSDGSPVVWLVTDRRRGRGVLEPRPVRVIAKEGSWTRIDADLHPGDLVAFGVADARAGERVVLGADLGTEGGAS